MNRTLRMMRRTLLCAVFACPLAFFHPAAARLVWGAFAASLCFMPAAQPLWVQKKRPSAGRAACSFLYALFLSAACSLAFQLLFPRMHPLTKSLLHMLSTLTGLSLQCAFLPRLHRTGKLHYIAAALCLLGFIVCMRSGA